MSLFFNRREERAVMTLPWVNSLLGGSVATKSGEAVTTTTALRHAAMWSSANLLASIVSGFPVDVFRGSGRGKVTVTPQPRLVANPSNIVNRRAWTYQGMMSALLRGNAVGYITSRDGNLRPATVEWLDPDAVTIEQRGPLEPLEFCVGGELLPADNVIHIPAFLRPGSGVGMSVVQYHAESIGIGLAAQKFGAQFYGDGGHPTAIFKNTAQTMTPDQARQIKERIVETLKGSREPLTLGADWTYDTIQVAPNESQFIEAMGYTDAQIARLFAPGLAEILGYGSQGSTLTYSNRVDRSLDLLTYGVLPWVQRFEDALTAAIAQPQTVRYNTSGLLRVDPKSQRDIFKIDREIGLHSIDEMRDLLDEPPLPDGAGEDTSPLGQAGRQRDVAETIQKVYLGVVNGVITADEARQIINAAGGNLPVTGAGQ